MTVVLLGNSKRFIGTAADTKPTGVPAGSTFYAQDTGVTYVTYDNGTNWVNSSDDAVSVGSSENLIGLVGAPTDLILVTPTMSVGGAPTTGQYAGKSTAPEFFASVNRLSGGKAVLKSIVITDKLTTAAVAMELWLFSGTFTAPLDRGSWTITDTDALLGQGVIAIETGRWYASGANKMYSDDRLGMIVKPAGRDLYFALVPRGTGPAWATGDLQIGLGFLQA